MLKKASLIKVQTLSKKLARQIRVISPSPECWYDGSMEDSALPIQELAEASKEENELARNVLHQIVQRKIGPLGWATHNVIFDAAPNCVLWLVEFRNQFYWIEKPHPDFDWWDDSFRTHNNLEQLFVS